MRWAPASLALAAAMLAASPAEAHHYPMLVQLDQPFGAATAGYFVAEYQGFYEEAEIGVTFAPGTHGMDTPSTLGKNGVNIVVAGMPRALAAREAGVPMVNIGQVFAQSGIELICSAGSGVKAPADLKGRRIGIWADGDRLGVLAWLAAKGLKRGDVTLVDQGHDPALLLGRQADCISASTYDEAVQLSEAGARPEDLVVLSFAEAGPAPLEDGYWVEERLLKDPDMVWGFASFLFATQRGWAWAHQNPVEAVRIVQEFAPPRSLDEKAQVRRMREINRLTDDGTSLLDPAAFQETVAMLLATAPDAGITAPPHDAWTHAPAEQAGIGDLPN